LISLVVLARSSNESDAKSDRGLKNWAIKRRLAEIGKPLTRMTPAWITYDNSRKCFSLNKHAETVERIFELAAQGFGTALIVQTLIKEELAPMNTDRRKDGGTWSRRYVTLILENRAVLGDFATGQKNQSTADKRILTGNVISGYFPRVSPKIGNLWDRVHEIRMSRKPEVDIRNRRGDFTNLFAGLCRCACCGSAMTLNHRQKPSTISYLRCPARYLTKTCKDGQTYRYDRLEKTVLNQLEGVIFPKVDFEQSGDDNDLDDELSVARTKMADLRTRIENLLDQAETEGMREVSDRITQRKIELEAAQKEVSALEQRNVLSKRTISLDEYVLAIAEKRREAESDDPTIRSVARSQIRLNLQRLIKRIDCKADRSVSVYFDMPVNRTFGLDISSDGTVVLNNSGADASVVIRWRSPSGGVQTARRLA